MVIALSALFRSGPGQAAEDAPKVMTVTADRWIPPTPKVGRPADPIPFPEIRDWRSLRLSLSRGGCGNDHRVTIHGDGLVEFDGTDSPVLGHHTTRIPIGAVRLLVDRLRRADYFRSWELYGLSDGSFGTDMCLSYMETTIQFDNRTKSIRSNSSGHQIPEGMPPEFAALPQAIDELAAGLWLKPSVETIHALEAEPGFHLKEIEVQEGKN